LGIGAFLFFIIYDINSVTKKRQLFGGSFFIGFVLLIISTVGIVTSSLDQTAAGNLGIVYFSLAALFLILLIYTLFMAIPFKETYIKAGNKPAVCESGVYALCRHPGVLWFTGFYFFTWLALPSPLLLAAAAIFSILNIVYVIFQDRWTFMLAFENYNEYKRTTPFLIPNLGSIKKCMRTIF
jgi:protein-S-isoprenylcysteine O-methyltransferase Ste14